MLGKWQGETVVLAVVQCFVYQRERMYGRILLRLQRCVINDQGVISHSVGSSLALCRHFFPLGEREREIEISVTVAVFGPMSFSFSQS